MGLTEEEQYQQLLQSYAQATRQDLANLTASSLAQAMVSPMTVSGLASSLLQQLHAGIIITAMPGPTSMTHATSAPMEDTASDDEDPKRGNVRTMSNDERRQRRLLRNRVAAKECRKKKKQYIQEMEDKIRRLEEENMRLHKQVAEIHTKLMMDSFQTNEGYRLMKEVEELNAKLCIGHLPTTSVLTAAVMAAAQQALKTEDTLFVSLQDKEQAQAQAQAQAQIQAQAQKQEQEQEQEQKQEQKQEQVKTQEQEQGSTRKESVLSSDSSSKSIETPEKQ